MSARMPTKSNCAFCGTSFHPRYNSARKFCSAECAGLAKVKNTFEPARTAEERAAAQAISDEMTAALARARATKEDG